MSMFSKVNVGREPLRGKIVAAGQESGRELVIVRPVVPPSWRQGGFLVCDASMSMTDQIDVAGRESSFSGSKAEAVGQAVTGLLDRMKVSSKANNFYFAEVDFTDRVAADWGPTPLVDVDTFADYTPTRHGTGGTLLAAGLERAQRLVADFLATDVDRLPASAVVLLMTDGECADPDRTRRAAQALLEDPRVTLACAFFATKGQTPNGLGLLQDICSQPRNTWCRTVYDPETLREFFHRSMTNPATHHQAASAGNAR